MVARIRGPFLLALALCASALPAAPVRLVTFGPEAAPGKGDDDYSEELFLRVPSDLTGPLDVQLFDPDVGGSEDEPNGNWNTRTRFTLFGGAGAARTGGGERLAEAVFGEDPGLDGRWRRLARIDPRQGDADGDVSVFRLLVQGVSGDDGNLYDIQVRAAGDAQERPATGVEILDVRPALAVPPDPTRFAEARLQVPVGTRALSIRGFDLDRARALLEMPFVAAKTLRSSGDARWQQDEIEIPADASPPAAAVLIRGGRTLFNDLVLEVADQDGRPLAFRLPVRMVSEPILPRPSIDFTFQPDCRSVAFDGGASEGVDDHLTDYRWDFGDGRQGAGARIEHGYDQPGTYEVALTVIDDSGRAADRARTRAQVKINRPPQAVPGPRRTLAPGERADFDAGASRDPDGRLIGYRWDFGDGSGAGGREASHSYAQPGRYPVTLSAEDDGPGPCTQSEAKTQVWVNAAPLPEAGPDQVVAVGEPVRLDAGASRDPDGKIQGYRWDFGDGAAADGARVEHAYERPGRYQVVLTTTDDAGVGNSEAQDRLGVWVNAPPVAAATGAERGAVDEPLNFDAAASQDPDGALIEHRWDFGDGATAEGVTVVHRYAAPGTYVVTLRVRDDSGASSAVDETLLKIVVNDPPVADAGPDQWVTASEVRFDGGGSRDPDGRIQSWRWDFGDGESGEGATPRHVYAAPGTYAVRLSVTDDSGTPSATTEDGMQVRLNERPVADAGPDQLGVPGQTLTFDGAGSFDPDGRLVEYRWDFGDGSGASGVRVTHVYDRPGRYDVGLEVRDDSGHATAFATADALVRINAAPVAVAGPDQLVAPGDPVWLDAGASYDPDGEIRSAVWRLDDADPIAAPKAELSFDTPGVVTARLEVTDDSGAANARSQGALSIRVNHPPSAVLAPRIDQCELRVRLDGSDSSDPDADPLRFLWDFGDASPPGHGARVVHRFAQAGRYPVTLRVDDGTGLANATDSAAAEIWIHRPPVAVAEAPDLVCAGDLVLFNGTRSQDPDGGQLLYAWDFGDGSSAQTVSPVKRYDAGGHYAVTLGVQDDSALSCNRAQARIGLTVVDAPVAVAGEDRRVCAGQPITFDGTASRDFDGVVNAYQWDFGDGEQGGGAQPTHLYAGAGDYRVTLTITGDRVGDCSNRNSDQLQVRVLQAPRVAIRGPVAVPVQHELALQAVPADDQAGELDPGLSVRWDFGDGSRGEGDRVTHAYATAGRYQVVLSVDDGLGGLCSQTRRLHSVLVNAPPEAVAGPDLQVAQGEPLVLDGSASLDPDGVIKGYRWDFGDGARGEGVRLTHRYQTPGVYTVELSVTDDSGLANAADSDRLEVRVNAPPVPRIAVSPAAPCPDEEVGVDAGASTDPDGSLTAWVWDFGDGARWEGVRAAHRYTQPGRYSLSLALSDDSGLANATATAVRDIQVNRAPIAAIRRPLSACPGQSIGFDASDSLDSDGRITGYDWRFGDGDQGVGATATHSYAAVGRYPVELIVTDDSGSGCARGRALAEAVVNAAPTARIQASSEVAYLDGAHEAIQFDATASSDPDADPLVYLWDFGDGGSGRGPKVAHRFTQAGRYQVTLRVRDDSGTDCAEATAQTQIRVEDARPAP